MEIRITSFILPAAALLLTFAAAGGTCLAQAQDDPNRPVLPDIAPRVVEIRGQLEISMPSLQRQPLIGFNPPPQVTPIPPDRRPFVEDYKQESVDLPPSPLQAPQPPSVASLISRRPRNGLMEAAAGRYFSRAIRFRTEWPVSDQAAVYSKLDYDGSDGHQPFQDQPEVHASFDALDATVGLQFVSHAAAFGVEVDGYLNNYMLFAAEPTASAGELSNSPPDREGRGGGIAGWVRSQAASAIDFDARLRYGSTLYNTQAANTAAPAALRALFETEESTLDADADIRIPFAPGQAVLADARFTGVGRGEDAVGGTIRVLDTGGGVHIGFQKGLELTALGRFMTYASEAHRVVLGATEGRAENTFVSIELAANLYPAVGVRFYVQNRPHAERHTLASLYRQNPYLVDDPVVQPTIYTINARGGGHLVKGMFEADIYAGFQQAPNFLFFTRATDDESYGYGSRLLNTHYDEAEIILFGGDISVNLPSGLNATIGLTVRDGKLTQNDTEIPYFGPLAGRGSISYSFADGRGFLKAIGRYESARYVDIPEARKIGDFFDLDLEGSFDLTPSLGAVLRFQNLSAGYLEQWEDFDQSPFVLMGGVQVRW